MAEAEPAYSRYWLVTDFNSPRETPMKITAIALAMSILCLTPVQSQAADLWSSYSVNTQSGAWGFAMGRPSSNAAYNDARNGCGRTGCYEILSKFTPCIALYVVNRNGRRTFSAGSGNSLAAAENVARRKFSVPGDARHVHSLCYQ